MSIFEYLLSFQVIRNRPLEIQNYADQLSSKPNPPNTIFWVSILKVVIDRIRATAAQ